MKKPQPPKPPPPRKIQVTKYKNSDWVTGILAMLFLISLLIMIWIGTWKVSATLFILVILSIIFGSAFNTMDNQKTPFHETEGYKAKRKSRFQTRIEKMEEERRLRKG
jgi:hypothetical protein